MARVGFIADDMVDEPELRVPLARIGEAGHEVILIGTTRGKRIHGRHGRETFIADRGIEDIDADALDALVIPGGFSPDKLRTDPRMVDLVRDIFDAGKPLGTVCRGAWLLAEADIADGLALTSWPAIRTDLINAGARWSDAGVVEDENIITARMPADLPAFCDAILRALQRSTAERAQAENTEQLEQLEQIEHVEHVEQGRQRERRQLSTTVQGVSDLDARAHVGNGRAIRPWRGGEGEGSPKTHDLGGLEQREHLLPDVSARALGNNEAVSHPISEEAWLSGRLEPSRPTASRKKPPRVRQDVEEIVHESVDHDVDDDLDVTVDGAGSRANDVSVDVSVDRSVDATGDRRADEPGDADDAVEDRGFDRVLRAHVDPDAAVEAGATTGPHSEERITLADVERAHRARHESTNGRGPAEVFPSRTPKNPLAPSVPIDLRTHLHEDGDGLEEAP